MKHIYFTLLFSLLLFERVSIAQEEEPIAPTVSTDKEDYLPGEYVIVKGTGWQPGETVSLHFEEEPKRCSNDHIRTTVADASGNIYYDQFLINDYHKGVFFHLTASEANTGKWAETWFTDGMITVTTNMLWSQLDDPDIAGFQPPSGNDVITVKTGAILTVNVSNAVASSVNLAGGNPDRGSGTLKFNSGSKLTVNGPVSMGASVYVSYGWPRSGGYTVEYNGVIDMTAGGTLVTTILDPRYYWPCSYCSPSSLGTLISGTGTIEITGSATLPSGNSFATYNNLIISSSGSVSTSNAFQTTINSNLTINGSLSLQGQLNIKGNLTFGSAGILNTSTHNITFNGSSNQAILKSGGAVIPLYDLTVSKSSGVLNISNDITISNVLRLNQGNVSTGLRKVYVSNSFPSSVIRSNGYINGNLERAVGIGSGNYLFPIGTSSSYAPVTISMNNVTTAGRLLARTNDGDHAEISTSTSLDPSNSVNRNWAITNSGAEFSDYGISLNFVASDKDPGLNTDTFILGKIDNGEWSYPNVITRTPTSISANGMTSFSSFVAANSLVSEDLVAPVLTVETLTPFTAQCLVNFSDLTIPTAMDNVDGTIQGITNQSIFPITQQGSYTITWTYTDTAGNSSTQNQTIIVDDTTAPVPALAPLPVVSGQCSVTVTAPTAIDACEGTITGTTTDPTSYTAQGAYTITWTYDDGNGNTSTQIQTVIVDDTAAPVPALAELPTISGQCSATVTAPTANDACAGTITGTTTDPLTYDAQGAYTITWTYDDGNGNTSTQTQTVIVDDTTAPVPAVAELPTISGQCSATVTAPTANDACAGTIMGTTTDPLTYDAQGTYTITWTYTDAAGNSSTQNQTIIVDDTTAPIPSVAQLPVVSGQCSVTVTAPTANDSCEGTITGTTTDPTSYTAQGAYTITWTYDDGNGNTSTQIQTVIVDDTAAPVPALAELPTISGQCSATVTAPTANDACAGTITGTTTDPTSYTEQGTYTITWTYDDGNGNTSTQTQTVTVDDTTAPVPGLAELPTISGQCSATVTAPTANDACAGTIIGTTTDPLTYDAQGTYTITWTYTDAAGNSSTQNQTIIVDDTTAPIPSVAQLPAVSAQCSVTVTPPTANDACAGTITGTTTDPLNYDAQGTYTITWTYDDGNGNTSTQTQTVIVDDTTAPVPTVAQLPTISGQCAVEVSAPTANDACEGTITGTTTDPLTYDTQGTYTINWTYDDGNGNTSTQTQTVIVDDTTAPVPTVAQLPIINGQCSATVTAPTANDACEGTITGTTTDPTSYTEQGNYTITWTYDDGNGNTSTQTQTVIVDDTTAPVPAVSQLAVVSGQCSVEVSAPKATDACEGEITGTTTDQTSFTEQGTYTITWTYDDGNGNVVTQDQTVIVDDTTAPVPAVSQLAVVSGQCSVEVSAPKATDACEGEITGTTTDQTSFTEQGTYTITWTYDDGNGNVVTQDQTVIVDDTTAPVPALVELPVISAQCSVTVTAPTANDSCKGIITGTTTDPLTYSQQGTYTITWTYDDGNGNTSAQVQTVIVDDTTAPVPALAELPVITGQCAVTVTSPPTAKDACEGTITGTTTDPTIYTEQGTYIITWIYDDGNGNTSTQTQTVIVDDTTAPVPAVAELQTISGQCAAGGSAPKAIDACEGEITGTTTDPTSYTEQGTYTITWTYVDSNGNTSTQTQTVIVDDTTAPVPALAQLPVASGQCSVSVTAPTANDACEGTITGTTTDPLTYSTQGTYTINWRYDDGNGNSVTQQQTVIVNDTTIPTWSTAAGSLNRTISCGQNELLAQALLLTPVAGDNCSVMSVEKTAGAFVPFGPNGAGTITNTWVAFDVAGNESEVFTQVITVEGIQIDASASSTPVQLGSTATLSASVTPAVAGVSVKFYLDDVLRGTSITNSNGTATLAVSGLALNVYKVTAIVGDGCAESVAYLPVYDPNGNFVTGGGWINSPEGALIGTTTIGKANFGFVSKYKKGSNQVDGNTEFQFSAGNLNFKSTLHEAGTLVISGRKATYRGDGTVNGVPGYRFTITAIDGHWNGGTGPDQFRIKIWGSNGVLYDNGLGADDNSDIATSLGGGSIVIHEAKARGTKRVVTDLITVPWNTSAETIKQKVDQMSTAWFESRKLEMILDANSYDPLTPGFYELKADLVENEFFKLDEPISILVLVQDKPKALDIELSTKSVSNQMKSGDQVAILNTIDPVDNIHTYRSEGNPDLAVVGNRLIWKGTGMPDAELKLTVFSTDRAGQTISKEITLFRELKIGEFLIYPNPAEDITNVLVELDQPSQVSLSVFDAVGRMVISDQFSRETTFVQTLDLMGIAPGMYTVQVQAGKVVMTGRLIKK